MPLQAAALECHSIPLGHPAHSPLLGSPTCHVDTAQDLQARRGGRVVPENVSSFQNYSLGMLDCVGAANETETWQ